MGRPSKAELQARRRTVGQQPSIELDWQHHDGVQAAEEEDYSAQPSPPEQGTAQPVAMPLDPDGVAQVDPLLAADQVAPWLAPAEGQPGTRNDSPACPGMRD